MAFFTNIPPALPTEKAYQSDKVPINSKKIADLKKLEKYVIRYEDIYGIVFRWPTTETDDCPIDVEVEFVYFIFCFILYYSLVSICIPLFSIINLLSAKCCCIFL